jgi:formiminoglutamase
MQDLSAFFTPITVAPYGNIDVQRPSSLGKQVDLHTEEEVPDWYAADIVLLGWPFDEGASDVMGSSLAPDAIREKLYRLASPGKSLKLADLGNLRQRGSQEQAIEGLSYVLEQLAKAQKIAIVLGGTQELTLAQYFALESLERPVQAVMVDSRLDINFYRGDLASDSYAYYLFSHSPSFLRQFTLLGAQSYFINEEERTILTNLAFDITRVSELRADPRLAEPALRHADLVSFDIGALRMGDAPGRDNASPAGFSIEEACALARFAGMGHRLTSFSLCEVNPELDVNAQTSQAAALILWHVIEGYLNRHNDEPLADRSNLQAYRVPMGGKIKELTFYYSEDSERWWMQVPGKPVAKGGPIPIELVPCTETDYLEAAGGELPERWISWQKRLFGL